MSLLDADRLFPVDPRGRELARALYLRVRDLPIVSPHGHTDPRWFANNEPFSNPAELFVTPDHYVFRMLYSQGINLDELGVARSDGSTAAVDPRQVWRVFASNYHLFRGTPSRLWIDYSFCEVFGIDIVLSVDTADEIYDRIADRLAQPGYRPRALFDRFRIEVIATTEGALDSLEHHATIAASDWNGRVITTYRPDSVIDPDNPSFIANLKEFANITGEDTLSWTGYLEAHRKRRRDFIASGATATDHGHLSARTENLSDIEAKRLFEKVVGGSHTPEQAEVFRAQMLTEMAKMSLDDGLVMQIHPGSLRNHSTAIFEKYGADKGFDIPRRTDYVTSLRPLLDVAGHEPSFTLIVFTLDETAYGR
ncbi:MAG: glucuronate isomerase, partial [Boseongicola sp.]